MAPSQYRFAVLDVFTSTPFTGNQLALVQLPDTEALTREQRHAIAREFNFSETVFLYDQHEDHGVDEARKVEIWTPFAELPFAGHPTIGTAWYCGTEFTLGQFALQLLAGRVAATFDPSSSMAEAVVPHNMRIHSQQVPASAVWKTQPKLAGLVHQSSEPTFREAYPQVSIVKGMTFVLVDLPSVDDHLGLLEATTIPLEGVQPDAGWASTVLAPYFYTPVAPSAGEPHLTRLRTRMIEAHVGEDPATGSAASTLCAYLSLQRGDPNGEHIFELEQGVEMGRRSLIRVTVTLNHTGQAVERVRLAGSAVVTMRGVLTA